MALPASLLGASGASKLSESQPFCRKQSNCLTASPEPFRRSIPAGGVPPAEAPRRGGSGWSPKTPSSSDCSSRPRMAFRKACCTDSLQKRQYSRSLHQPLREANSPGVMIRPTAFVHSLESARTKHLAASSSGQMKSKDLSGVTSEKDKCGRTLNLGACNVSCPYKIRATRRTSTPELVHDKGPGIWPHRSIRSPSQSATKQTSMPPVFFSTISSTLPSLAMHISRAILRLNARSRRRFTGLVSRFIILLRFSLATCCHLHTSSFSLTVSASLSSNLSLTSVSSLCCSLRAALKLAHCSSFSSRTSASCACKNARSLACSTAVATLSVCASCNSLRKNAISSAWLDACRPPP
mmetsp:Transcript_4474/g.12655  ORF Transcript_4474/g.12655 Transcript_4474/m.12655 type:complete len:352 (+) Transcript_4474:340-1395(+)